MSPPEGEIPGAPAAKAGGTAPRRRASRPGRTHGLYAMRRSLSKLTTRRLDGRSALAVTARKFKDNVRADRGGDLTRAQEVILEAAAQAWLILQAIDDYILRQPSLVTKKRQVGGGGGEIGLVGLAKASCVAGFVSTDAATHAFDRGQYASAGRGPSAYPP